MNVMTGDLAFIPLGGTGEIGMNLNVYRCDGALLAVDCGLGFAGPDQPEADVMVPDAAWLAENRNALLGLIITHAHEDHIGAVVHLWRQLRFERFRQGHRRHKGPLRRFTQSHAGAQQHGDIEITRGAFPSPALPAPARALAERLDGKALCRAGFGALLQQR